MANDLGTHFRWQCLYTLAKRTRALRKTGPVVLERRVVETDHDRHLDHIHQTGLAPDGRLSVCPYDRPRFSLVSQRAHSFVEDGCGVAHQVGGGKAAPEVEGAGSNGPAAARHPPHLADDLIDLRYDIDSKDRDAGIEGGVRIWHATCVAQLIDDIRVRSLAAGAFEVGLRGVQPDDRTTPVRQRRCYNTRPTADVQHPVACLDPRKIEE